MELIFKCFYNMFLLYIVIQNLAYPYSSQFFYICTQNFVSNKSRMQVTVVGRFIVKFLVQTNFSKQSSINKTYRTNIFVQSGQSAMNLVFLSFSAFKFQKFFLTLSLTVLLGYPITFKYIPKSICQAHIQHSNCIYRKFIRIFELGILFGIRYHFINTESGQRSKT